MGPIDLCLLVFTPLASLPRQWIRTGHSDPTDYGRCEGVWCLMLGHEKTVAPIWVTWFALSLPCCEDSQAALGRGPRGGELRPPVNSHVNWSGMWVEQVLQLRPSLQMATALKLISDFTLWESMSQSTWPGHSWLPDPQKLWEMITI